MLLDLVYRDLVGTKRHDTGRLELNVEQVLRCGVLKQYRQLSYEELAFHLDYSSAFRGFSRLEMGQYPCKSILQDKTKSLREETEEAIHEVILGYARREAIETGRKIRVGSTAGKTEIHPSRSNRYSRQGQSGHPVRSQGASFRRHLVSDPGLPDRARQPADSDSCRQRLQRHEDCFGRMPRQVAADGGFAS